MQKYCILVCLTNKYQTHCCTSKKITKNVCTQHIYAQKKCNKDYLFCCVFDNFLSVHTSMSFYSKIIIDCVCFDVFLVARRKILLKTSRFARVIEQIIATCTKKHKTYTTINYPLKKRILVSQQKIIKYTKNK